MSHIKRKGKEDKQALVLLSGGLDSTACLDFLCSNSYKVTSLFIDYGQLARNQEQHSAKKISRYFGVPFIKLKLDNIHFNKTGLLIGRNLFLFSTALMVTKFRLGIIASGIHKGTNYLDCGLPFLNKVQEIYDVYTGGRIRVFTPFADWVKMDIWQYSLQKSVPIKFTYSCEKGTKKPCGKCLSCIDMINLNASKK